MNWANDFLNRRRHTWCHDVWWRRGGNPFGCGGQHTSVGQSRKKFFHPLYLNYRHLFQLYFDVISEKVELIIVEQSGKRCQNIFYWVKKKTCLGILDREKRDKANETSLKEGGGIEMSIYSAFPYTRCTLSSLCIYLPWGVSRLCSSKLGAALISTALYLPAP